MDRIRGIEELGYVRGRTSSAPPVESISYRAPSGDAVRIVVMARPVVAIAKEREAPLGRGGCSRWEPVPLAFDEVRALDSYVAALPGARRSVSELMVEWGPWERTASGGLACEGANDVAAYAVVLDPAARTASFTVSDWKVCRRACPPNAACLRKAAEGVAMLEPPGAGGEGGAPCG